ncbi:MAG: copper chaperone PCu(A)C [Candidatus Latescibacterota bacterium]|jgi:hypothetical protein
MPALSRSAFRAGLLLAAFLCGCGSPDGEAAVAVRQAWIRAVPSPTQPTAAYLVIENRAPAAVVLRAVETPLARRVELHESVQDGEYLRMRRLDGIEVPARGTVELRPGGLHLMLLELTQVPRAGETVALRLFFEGSAAPAGAVAVQAEVRGLTSPARP